jgi:lipopolysaccharide transport system permease protein
MSLTQEPATLLKRASVDPVDVPVGPEHEETIIQPRSGWVAIDWSELVRSRELLYFLIWRDVKIRYKQTVVGVAWAVLQPLFTMMIFTIIFGMFAKIDAKVDMPYPVFVFAGMTAWTFFSSGVSAAGVSLISQQHLLTKVYFPRLFIPTASVGALLIDLMISLGILAVLMAWNGVAPSWQAPLALPLIGVMAVATLGLGFLTAALTVVYRDFRYLITFAIQIGMYLSPVIYPPEMVPARYHPILALNPMFGLIDGFRSAVLGTPWHPIPLAISTASALALFVLGLFYFRRAERRFADLA